MLGELLLPYSGCDDTPGPQKDRRIGARAHHSPGPQQTVRSCVRACARACECACVRACRYRISRIHDVLSLQCRAMWKDVYRRQRIAVCVLQLPDSRPASRVDLENGPAFFHQGGCRADGVSFARTAGFQRGRAHCACGRGADLCCGAGGAVNTGCSPGTALHIREMIFQHLGRLSSTSWCACYHRK